MLITLDVKNACNSASWELIMKKLERRKISSCIKSIISSYFGNRMTRVAKVERRVSAGVPQDSIVGPLLWNLLYDGVLKT